MDRKIKNADHALTELVKTTGSSLLQLNGHQAAIGADNAASGVVCGWIEVWLLECQF